MNLFGWFTVIVWSLAAVSPTTMRWESRLISVFMVVGTLVWGTGHA